MKGIAELRNKGVFALALIKKGRYWPKFIKGNDVKAQFVDSEVGAVDACPGHMDGVKFHVICIKEPDYGMSLMTTYGTTELMGDARLRSYKMDGVKRRNTTVYFEVVYNHFQVRDVVDANNFMRMFPLALEETWKTLQWPKRAFQLKPTVGWHLFTCMEP